MKLSKTSKLVVATGLSVLAVGGATAGIVGAQANATHRQELIDKVAKSTNLDSATVTKVLDAVHSEREANREARQEERLSKLVTDGKITEEQKTKIIAKLKELEANRPDLGGKTKEEVRALMETHRTELEQWAKDNGIDLSYLRPFGGKGGMMGGGMRGHGMGEKMGDHMGAPDDAPTNDLNSVN